MFLGIKIIIIVISTSAYRFAYIMCNVRVYSVHCIILCACVCTYYTELARKSCEFNGPVYAMCVINKYGENKKLTVFIR